MRRLGVLLSFGVLAVLLAPGAAFARVAEKAVDKAPAAVDRFWTAERMENATPVEEARAAAAPPPRTKKPPRTSANAVMVPPPYTSAPTRTNGKVFFSDGGSNYVCSGTALLSGNESTVWTAGHCVHDGGGGFHTNWAFVPAYSNGTAPYGTWSARTLLTTQGWSQGGDFSFDVGAAVVAPVGSASLTDTIGGRNIAFNASRTQAFQAYGYPAGSPFDGSDLWVCSGTVTYTDSSANPPTMGLPCDMTGGSSGGGWIGSGGAVTSVNSYGYGTLPDVMFGPYQGAVAEALYTQAASS